MEKVTFKRSVKPYGEEGQSALVVFSDASEQAFRACAYVRWNMRKMPRLELNDVLLGARLQNFIRKNSRLKFSKKHLIVDSEIVRAMIQTESFRFNTSAGC